MSHSLRDLDRGEGAALHAHLFEETVDWSEPIRKQKGTCINYCMPNILLCSTGDANRY